MEGVKFVVNKVLSSYFQVVYIIYMSVLGLLGYYFYVVYVGDWQFSFIEVFFIVVGDMDSSGSLNVQVMIFLVEWF